MSDDPVLDRILAVVHADPRFRAAILSGSRADSAQITDLYSPEGLVGKLVVGVVNLPPMRVGPVVSECLITGFHDEASRVVLCVPERPVPLGTKLL
jgi:tRNA-binding protein